MKKDTGNQLFFDFDAPFEMPEAVENAAVAEKLEAVVEPSVTEAAETETPIKPAEKQDNVSETALYQAVLAHLVKNNAAAAALHVPCRQKKFKAPVAAYYSEYKGRCNRLSGTVVVDIYSQRCQCIPECAGSAAVARELVELKQQRADLETQIRIDEPHLQAEDELFDEFRSYDFSRSCNKNYHKLCRRIISLEQSLYKGTRMEQLARAAVADYLIIAVPENLISADEMPDNWGVWYIMPDKTIREIKMPEKQQCSDLSRLHLLQNIGHAALNSVLFANGVKISKNGKVRFTRQPRARRK